MAPQQRRRSHKNEEDQPGQRTVTESSEVQQQPSGTIDDRNQERRQEEAPMGTGIGQRLHSEPGVFGDLFLHISVHGAHYPLWRMTGIKLAPNIGIPGFYRDLTPRHACTKAPQELKVLPCA
jgi:hypothetical protein